MFTTLTFCSPLFDILFTTDKLMFTTGNVHHPEAAQAAGAAEAAQAAGAAEAAQAAETAGAAQAAGAAEAEQAAKAAEAV